MANGGCRNEIKLLFALFLSSPTLEGNIWLFICQMLHQLATITAQIWYSCFLAESSCLLQMKTTLMRAVKVNQNSGAAGWKTTKQIKFGSRREAPWSWWKLQAAERPFSHTSSHVIYCLYKNIDYSSFKGLLKFKNIAQVFDRVVGEKTANFHAVRLIEDYLILSYV